MFTLALAKLERSTFLNLAVILFLQIKEEQRFPHLHIRDTAGQPRDDGTTPRYQMTNMA